MKPKMTTSKQDCRTCSNGDEPRFGRHCNGCWNYPTGGFPRCIPHPALEVHEEPEVDTSPVLPMVIGLYSSTMASGKTTVADELVENYGFTIVRFADCLKSMMVTFFEQAGMSSGLAEKLVHDPELKEQQLPILGGKTPRWAMQTLGTEWGRECISRRLWVEVTLNRVSALLEQGKPVVIDDMRFHEEIDALREIGAKTVRVYRPGKKAVNGHVSEGLLDQRVFSAELINNLHIRYIPAKVRKLMLQLQS